MSARVREKSIKVYVGSFSSRREAEFAAQQHRVTQRGIKDGELPAAVDHKRTMGDALDAWLKAIKEQRSHDEYESRMRLYVRPTFDSTPLVKITKAKLIDLRTSLNGKLRDECLSLEWFRSRPEAVVVIETWRRHYNEVRPHSSLGYLTPHQFKQTQCVAQSTCERASSTELMVH